jgi:peptide/nickel transport system substrate-binding protein
MDRRTFLESVDAGVLAAAGGFPPQRSPNATPRTNAALRSAGRALLSGTYIVRNAGLLVWDMLCGVDNRLTPRRQMVEAQEISADGLTWTFRLQAGLKFYDGERVRAKDAVASINRWSAPGPWEGCSNERTPIHDCTFRWALRKPCPKMLLPLGKTAVPCVVMPAGVAATPDGHGRRATAERRSVTGGS